MLCDPVKEVCGLIIGHTAPDGVIEATTYKALPNTNPNPISGFEMHPEKMMKLINIISSLNDDKAKIVGCFHSHPHWSGQPSRTDYNAAKDFDNDFAWLIYGGLDGKILYHHFDGADFVKGDIQIHSGIHLNESQNIENLQRLGILTL